MTPEKKKYLERRAKQKELMEKKAGRKRSRAKKQGIELVSSLDKVKKAEIIAELRAQGMSDYEIKASLEAPCKFLVTKRKKK